jgi:chromate reductase, NAD(P)H dehydrogenase (quinone)
MSDMTIVGLAGSVRRGSLNAALLRAAAEVAPAGVRVEIASIAGIPLYDGDVEQSTGVPAPAAVLKDRIAAAQGLLLVTPEYNNGIPGVFKNAIDWLTRPPADIRRVFGNKPTGVIGASRGRSGTLLAQTAWLPVLRVLGTHAYLAKSLYLGGADVLFDGELRLVDAPTRQRLTDYMAGFAAFLRSS